MSLEKNLKSLDAIPFTHSLIYSYLSNYKDPNNKIQQMVSKGELIRIKRGLYVVGDTGKTISQELVANLLYGPSYVSLDYALAYYGLIPERVYEVTSITTKMRKNYDTPLGRYSYVKSTKCLHPIGITIKSNDDGTSFMIASMEKALCDKLIYTKNLQIISLKSLKIYLEQDLRIEFDELKTFDLKIIKTCLQCGYKLKLLTWLYKLIKQMQAI